MAAYQLPRRSTVTIDNRIIIGIMADEERLETTIGFLLAGIGECKGEGKLDRNFMIVTDDTETEEIQTFFSHLYSRKSIGVILLAPDIFKKVSHIIAESKRTVPIVLQIPTKKSVSVAAKITKRQN